MFDIETYIWRLCVYITVSAVGQVLGASLVAICIASFVAGAAEAYVED